MRIKGSLEEDGIDLLGKSTDGSIGFGVDWFVIIVMDVKSGKSGRKKASG